MAKYHRGRGLILARVHSEEFTIVLNTNTKTANSPPSLKK